MILFRIVSILVVSSIIAFSTVKIDDEELNEQYKVHLDSLKKNRWHIKHNNYKTYKQLYKEYLNIKWEIRKLSKLKQTKAIKEKISSLKQIQNTRNTEILLLKEYKDTPFGTLTILPELKEAPSVTNPFEIIDAFSHIKYIQHTKDIMSDNLEQIVSAMNDLEELKEILIISDNSGITLESIESEIADFKNVKTLYSTSVLVYEKKFSEIEESISLGIKEQVSKILNIAIIIFVFFIFSFFTKLLAKKYITDNERYYLANKIINIGNFVVIIFVLLFSYLENVSYLVTFLGFASAGIAIAMKDWFMSTLGWFVMTIGGSIHVGDRIRVAYDGMVYVGDVLDISLLRITLQEDITLTTYLKNKRAGRIIFIPNNYVFTQMISNYSHSGMKTVWDNVEVYITFDSNHKKALHISKEVAKKYSKGYTDITRKQLNKLRDKYNLRNTNVEPRAFAFVEAYGMNIVVWFQNNSYATLTLKSNIAIEIVETFLQEDDISIAYPTQSIHMSSHSSTKPPELNL